MEYMNSRQHTANSTIIKQQLQQQYKYNSSSMNISARSNLQAELEFGEWILPSDKCTAGHDAYKHVSWNKLTVVTFIRDPPAGINIIQEVEAGDGGGVSAQLATELLLGYLSYCILGKGARAAGPRPRGASSTLRRSPRTGYVITSCA